MNSRSAIIAFIAIIVVMLIASLRVYIPGWTYATVVFAFILANVYGSINVASQFFIKSLLRGSARENTIAITFDDGPVPGRTERILDILDEHGVKATFFCIGKNVKSSPRLLQAIHQRGHLVGNHSFYHGVLFDLQSASKMKKELTDTDAAIFETVGQRPRYFRPPYGVTNPMLSRAVSQTRHLSIGWSMRSLDTVIGDQQKLMDRITKRLKAGDILLMHDRCEVTVQILPALLRHIQQSGMRIEPLDKMLGEPAYA